MLGFLVLYTPTSVRFYWHLLILNQSGSLSDNELIKERKDRRVQGLARSIPCFAIISVLFGGIETDWFVPAYLDGVDCFYFEYVMMWMERLFHHPLDFCISSAYLPAIKGLDVILKSHCFIQCFLYDVKLVIN